MLLVYTNEETFWKHSKSVFLFSVSQMIPRLLPHATHVEGSKSASWKQKYFWNFPKTLFASWTRFCFRNSVSCLHWPSHMRQVFWVYPALKYSGQFTWEIASKICKKIFFSLTPALKTTILFESRQFEQVTICISVLKYISFSCRASISRVISIYTWDTFLGTL